MASRLEPGHRFFCSSSLYLDLYGLCFWKAYQSDFSYCKHLIFLHKCYMKLYVPIGILFSMPNHRAYSMTQKVAATSDDKAVEINSEGGRGTKPDCIRTSSQNLNQVLNHLPSVVSKVLHEPKDSTPRNNNAN